MEGTKIFKSVYYMTESTRKCQKTKKNRNWNLIFGSFWCIIRTLFHYFELWIKFCVVWNPVSVFQTKSRFFPSRQKPVLTQHYPESKPSKSYALLLPHTCVFSLACHQFTPLRLTCEFTCDWVQLSRRKESQGLAKILQTSSHYQINQCCNIIQKSCSWGELELWRGLDDLVLK